MTLQHSEPEICQHLTHAHDGIQAHLSTSLLNVGQLVNWFLTKINSSKASEHNRYWETDNKQEMHGVLSFLDHTIHKQTHQTMNHLKNL